MRVASYTSGLVKCFRTCMTASRTAFLACMTTMHAVQAALPHLVHVHVDFAMHTTQQRLHCLELTSLHGVQSVNEQRNGGWSSTGFHTVTAVVGAGVLGLPFSLSYLTWGGGAAVLAVAWLTSYYTLWQLAHMHERRRPDHSWMRFSRYHELAQYAMRSWGALGHVAARHPSAAPHLSLLLFLVFAAFICGTPCLFYTSIQEYMDRHT